MTRTTRTESRKLMIESIESWRREMRAAGLAITMQETQALLDRLSSIPGFTDRIYGLDYVATLYREACNEPC